MRLAILIATSLACGCAGTLVQPVTNDATDRGIRYYESAPFLLVQTDGHGGVTSRIVWLPDLRRIRSIDPYAVLSKNETTLKFDHGVLTQSKTVVDETVVPTGIITALEGVAKALVAANAPGARDVELPLPRLYRIQLEGGRARLVGGRAFGPDGTTPIESMGVTISQPADAKAAAPEKADHKQEDH